MFKEGVGDNQNLPEASIDEAMNDVEELARTNECYRKKGREATRKTLIHTMFYKEVFFIKKKSKSSGIEPRKAPT
jgi:hypothetical protein